jgi:hypothetical protein
MKIAEWPAYFHGEADLAGLAWMTQDYVWSWEFYGDVDQEAHPGCVSIRHLRFCLIGMFGFSS